MRRHGVGGAEQIFRLGAVQVAQHGNGQRALCGAKDRAGTRRRGEPLRHRLFHADLPGHLEPESRLRAKTLFGLRASDGFEIIIDAIPSLIAYVEEILKRFSKLSVPQQGQQS